RPFHYDIAYDKALAIQICKTLVLKSKIKESLIHIIYLPNLLK
ncbi:5155_t:CDS:1, partial [Gigaspora rosea]